MLRTYSNLIELVTKETKHIAPKSAARKIEEQISRENPGATALVLFKAGDGSWMVLPVGPNEKLHSPIQASRTKISGKSPVAYCVRNSTPPAGSMPAADAPPAPSYQ
jgi:hypothetical protein